MSDVQEPSDEQSAPSDGSPPPARPDYDLEPVVRADTPTQLKAMGHPVRNAILHLVLERAATTSELAEAIGKGHGTISHHLNVLAEAGLVRVVRTRQVRAVTERYWGRTGRTVLVEPPPGDVDGRTMFLREALDTFRDGDHGFVGLRYARIPVDQVEAFAARLDDLTREFIELPRAGATTYGLLLALQPTDQPALPDPTPAPAPGGPSADADGDSDNDNDDGPTAGTGSRSDG